MSAKLVSVEVIGVLAFTRGIGEHALFPYLQPNGVIGQKIRSIGVSRARKHSAQAKQDYGNYLFHRALISLQITSIEPSS